MKGLLALVVVLVSVLPVWAGQAGGDAGAAKPAQSEQPSAEAMKAAMRYFDAMDYNKSMAEAVELMASQAPEEVRPALIEHFQNYLANDYKKVVAALLTRHFTVEELNALAEFYESKVGRSINDKMIPFTMDMMQLNEREVMRMVVGFMDEHPELMQQR